MVRPRWLAVLALATAAAIGSGCTGTRSGEPRQPFFGRLFHRDRGVPCEMTEIPIDGCPPGPLLPDGGAPGIPTSTSGPPIVYPGSTPFVPSMPPGVPPVGSIPSPTPGLLPAPMPVGPATPIPADPSSIKGSIKAANR